MIGAFFKVKVKILNSIRFLCNLQGLQQILLAFRKYIYCYIFFKSQSASHSRVETLPRWFCPFKKKRKFFIFFFCSIIELQFLPNKLFFSKKNTLPIKRYEYFSKKKYDFFLWGLIWTGYKKKFYFRLGKASFSHFLPIYAKFQAESESVVKNIIIRRLNVKFFTFTKIFIFWSKSYFKGYWLKTLREIFYFFIFFYTLIIFLQNQTLNMSF